MPFDALTALLDAGHPLEFLTDAQRAVFADLSESEVELLNSIKSRLEQVDDGDVEGHELKVL